MKPSEYNRINELLSEFSRGSAALEMAEAEIKTVQLAAAQELLPRHAAAKMALAGVEGALKRLAEANYEELFPESKKRSHKTPFGELRFRRSTSLEFEDEENVVLRIELACQVEGERAVRAGEPARFSAEELLRVAKTPNLEALERLDDRVLQVLGVTRQTKDNFKVVPFDMASDKPAAKKEAA